MHTGVIAPLFRSNKMLKIKQRKTHKKKIDKKFPNQKIDLKFSRAGVATMLYSGQSTYRSSSPATDSLKIFNKKIEIISKRSTNAENPLRAHNSTFLKQIVKAICLYYIVEKHPNQLREIKITQMMGSDVVGSNTILKSDLRQVLTRSTDLAILGNIVPAKAAILLNESIVGRAVLNAATHLIKSLDSSSPFDRFEKLWRAFNALYKAFAKKSTDQECHVELRKHIEKYPGIFPLSIAKVSPLSVANIRPMIRFNQMILNNHPTQRRTEALKDSIERNKDTRILEIYLASLPVREKFLKNDGLYAATLLYIVNGIQAKVTRDSDVLSILCIKYMYFVRNKMAHAEKADHGFSFLHGGAEELEIRWLTPILEALVIDLINISDTF